jgi:acyl-CoA thioester hydrolase
LEPFPFETPVAVRFNDLDAMGHVNNALFATYFEEARAAFAREVFGLTQLDAFDFVVARVEIDYRRPLRYGEELRAALRVASVGESSFTIEYRLTAGGTVVATGKTVQVFYDYSSAKKKPVPEGFREKSAPYLAREAR